MDSEERLPYQGLDVVVDLRGNPLRVSSWGSGSFGSNSGRDSPGRGWRDRDNVQEGVRWNQRSVRVHSMGTHDGSGGSEVQMGEQWDARTELNGNDGRGGNIDAHIQRRIRGKLGRGLMMRG